MKSKTKTKKITKAKTVKKFTRVKNTPRLFHGSYLAMAIAALLIVEGLLFSFSSQAAWAEGMDILDMGPAVTQVADALAYTLAPVAETVSLVNQFYSRATDAAIELLDLRGSAKELVFVISSVTDFYQQASVAMENLLGISAWTINQPQVAGASVLSK